MIWSIAWRNVWRNKIRSLIIIASIALGLFGGIYSYAFYQGYANQQINQSINAYVSHIQLHNPEYLLNENSDHTIANTDSLVEVIEQVKHVKGVTRRTKVMAMASTAETGASIVINGINPERERQVTNIHEQIVEGSYFEEDRHHAVVIGQELAEKLKVDVKSKIVITVRDMDGSLLYSAYRVVGIYKIFNTNYEERNIFVRNGEFTELIGFPQDASNEIAVLLGDLEYTQPALSSINDKLVDLVGNEKVTIRGWREVDPLLQMINAFTVQFAIVFLFIILFALAFGIINTMLMVVMERVRELGMLMAVGMNKRKVFTMIMLETVFLSFTGAIAGMILSGIAVIWTAQSGVNLTAVAEGFNAAGYISHIYPEISLVFYIALSVIVFLVAALSSIYPARKALKMNPADAIRIDA